MTTVRPFGLRPQPGLHDRPLPWWQVGGTWTYTHNLGIKLKPFAHCLRHPDGTWWEFTYVWDDSNGEEGFTLEPCPRDHPITPEVKP